MPEKPQSGKAAGKHPPGAKRKIIKKVVKKEPEKKPPKKIVKKALAASSGTSAKPKKKIVKKKGTVNDFVKELVNYVKPKIGTAYMPHNLMTEYIYLKILDKYKNDCLLPEFDRKGKVFDPDRKIDRVSTGNQISANQFTNTILLPNIVSKIAKTYINCQKRKKLLLIPMTIAYSAKGERHANLITFNTFLNTVEYFEPHGKGYNLKKDKPINKLVVNLTNAVNAEFVKNKVDIKLKPSIALNSCPILPKAGKDTYNTMFGEQEAGFQGLQQQDDRKKIMVDGFKFTSPGGFCTMWGFIQMEIRLKFPTLPENEISSKLLEMIKDNPRKILDDLIFGYANSFMDDIIKIMGGAKNLKEVYEEPRSEQRRKMVEAINKARDKIEKRILKQ